MSNKTLRASLYFLGAVTALYLLVTMLRNRGEGVTEANSGLAAALASIDGQELTRIQFTNPRDTFVLQKEGDTWTVNGLQTDTAVVHRLLRALDDVEVQEVASTNPANHESLDISPDSAREMVTDGGVTILFGKHTPRTRTGYARLPGSDTVHVIHGDLRFSVGRSLFEWRNKVMLRVDSAAVAMLRVMRDGTTTEYERRDSTWTVNGVEADSSTVRNAIRNMLQELREVRASGFEPDYEMPEVPDRSIQALDADGHELASMLLMQEPGNWVVSSPATPYIFELPKFRGDRIAPEPPGES